MNFNIAIRIIFFLIIYSVLTFYIGWNVWVWIKGIFSIEHPWFYSLLFILIAYSYVISHFLKKWTIFKLIGSHWFAIFQYSILFFPIADLFVWILTSLGLAEKLVIFWTGIVILMLFILIYIFGTFNAYSPIVRKYSIAIPKKVSYSHLRIAMASDMHFGILSGVSHVHRLVREINALKPDIILLPGDIIDDDPNPFIDKNMGDIMAKLSAPLGVYGVLGNHEYYGGGIPKFLKEMKRIGITILQDEAILIDQSFYLVGRKDKTDFKRDTIEKLVTNIDIQYPIILMDHQPTELKQAEKNHVDLLLSGHTHRGQMAPNHLFTRKMFELDWGYLQKSQLHTFVSSGFGFWGPPLRIGSRSEVILIDITFSN
ncbi:MAG: metallophosphoesterase [Bacillota bacterium]|nr:metallophosphoesterase [Bacillota bacterium]